MQLKNKVTGFLYTHSNPCILTCLFYQLFIFTLIVLISGVQW